MNNTEIVQEDIKYIKLRTKNAKMMLLYGDKLTKSEWARSMRTNGLHTEIQHSDRYGNISFSCTLSDGCNGCRFKMIGYSHPYRWSTVYIPVTADQEARLFAKGCEMADMEEGDFKANYLDHGFIDSDDLFYGPNHIKYDKGAAFFSFISKRNIWKPSGVRMICNRACGEVLMSEWLDIFQINIIKGEFPYFADIPPHAQTPDQTEYLTAHYFDCRDNSGFPSVGNPTQQDIDNIVKEIE